MKPNKQPAANLPLFAVHTVLAPNPAHQHRSPPGRFQVAPTADADDHLRDFPLAFFLTNRSLMKSAALDDR